LKEVAGELGVSISTVNAWELGERFPKAEHFEALANYTGMPPCHFFCSRADECPPAEPECLFLRASSRRPAS
jgi:transcriptional regulator with XRE-family HTH domain